MDAPERLGREHSCHDPLERKQCEMGIRTESVSADLPALGDDPDLKKDSDPRAQKRSSHPAVDDRHNFEVSS